MVWEKKNELIYWNIRESRSPFKIVLTSAAKEKFRILIKEWCNFWVSDSLIYYFDRECYNCQGLDLN